MKNDPLHVTPGFLLLEDGTLFLGRLHAPLKAPATAEVVFTTSMSGYQETFTDPSYRGQIVVMTAPMIGNYGVNSEDPESAQPHVAGVIVRELSRTHSNWRAEQGLGEWLVGADVPVLSDGDVNARVWIRIKEIEQSFPLLKAWLADVPAGPTRVALPPKRNACEGVAMAEAFRGDALVWVRLEDGRIARCHARDASWFQWPLIEAAIENNIVADFPLCNKSFNCSYSRHDL